jgi:ArsR family transcriptional regulator
MDYTPDRLLRTLGDLTRLRTLVLLQQEGELCVCELTHALGVIQPKISRHLAILREEGLVRDRRDGHWVHYRITSELPDWVINILESCARGLRNDSPFSEDHRSLCDMPNRPGVRCCA